MDIRIRATSNNHNVKISIIDITESMQKITELQKTNPIASVVLSKFTAANVLIGLDFKNEEKTISNLYTSDGLTEKLISEFQNNKIRSYIQNPDFNVNNLNPENFISEAIGKDGTLIVTRDLNMKEPYVSRTDLIDGTIDNDFTNFFNASNQVKSFLSTHIDFDQNLRIKKVVGILVQLFPSHTEDDIDFLEQKFGNTKHLSSVLLKTTNYESLIKEMIEDAKVLEQKELVFECTCSDEKVLNSILMLGRQELEDIVLKEEEIKVICEFCKEERKVSWKDIKIKLL